MKHEFYQNISINEDYRVFEFYSIGSKGVIPKRIFFLSTKDPNIVNLLFGDINKEGELNVHSISNNGDRNKVLSTVCQAIELYLKKYPTKIVYFKGSTEERTRLYRIIISNNLKHFDLHYDILSEQESDFVAFRSNIIAKGFAVKRKQ